MYLQIVLLPHHDTDPFSVSTGLTWLHFPLLSFRAVSLSSCLSSNKKLYSLKERREEKIDSTSMQQKRVGVFDSARDKKEFKPFQRCEL